MENAQNEDIMSLNDFIVEVLTLENIPLVSLSGKSIPLAIEEGYRAAGYSAQGFSKFTKKYFPNKPNKVTIRLYLLELYNYRHCTRCGLVKLHKEFDSNTGRRCGKNNYCRPCFYLSQGSNLKRRAAEYKASKLNRTPKWANIDKIREIYEECPEGYHVDHIIPLNGINVSGLHVENNLQYLLAKDNLKKSNKYTSIV